MLARIRKSMEEKDEGFTLIELLVVIIIIGILAAIAIPVFLNQRKKGWDAQAKSDARNIATLEETNYTDANAYVYAGAATDTATLKTALTDYKPSANVTGALVAQSGGTNGFCVRVTSKSTKTFYYDSMNGGLLTSGTC